MRVRYWRRRFARHAILGVTSVFGAASVGLLFPERPSAFRLSMGTAYVSLGLLTMTLLLGPWNVLRGRANPLSTDLRRDVGIWAAVVAFVHIVFGLQVHLSGAMEQYFLWAPDSGHLLPFRYDVPGLANYAGLASGLVLLMLLAVSNDAALRRLGPARWKGLQRWNYAGFALMGVHAVLYQSIEQRSGPWMLVMVGSLTVVVATQIAGWRRRSEAL